VKRSLCEVFHLCDVGELKHGFVANSMARHGGKHTFGLVADLAIQAQAPCRVLAFPGEQCLVVWGLHVQAFAVLGLQVALATLNFRGVKKTD